ncbi:MAG: hypothetical protein JO053_08790 [Acidobacteria bacterium]|nr:hypothetical protein [Acidobacteriota bacterium]
MFLVEAFTLFGQAPFDCPVVLLRSDSVNAPPGQKTVFYADVVGPHANSPTYSWKVTGGDVLSIQSEGEGSYADIRPNRGVKRLEVSVTLGGIPNGCPAGATSSRNVARGRGVVDYASSLYILELDKTILDHAEKNNRVHIISWAYPSDALNVLIYHYDVTAGKIVGTGPDVIWDLSLSPPGEYSITAWVDDGCGPCGIRQTRKVVVK